MDYADAQLEQINRALNDAAEENPLYADQLTVCSECGNGFLNEQNSEESICSECLYALEFFARQADDGQTGSCPID